MAMTMSDEELSDILGTKLTEDSEIFKAALNGDKAAQKWVRHALNRIKIEGNARLRRLRKLNLTDFKATRDTEERLSINEQTRFRNLGELHKNWFYAWDEFNLIKSFLKSATSDPEKAQLAAQKQKTYLTNVLRGMEGGEDALERLNNNPEEWNRIFDFLHSYDADQIMEIYQSEEIVDMIAEAYTKGHTMGSRLIRTAVHRYLKDSRFYNLEGRELRDYVDEELDYDAKY